MQRDNFIKLDPASGQLPVKPLALEAFLATVLPEHGQFATFWSGTKKHYWAGSHEELAALITGAGSRTDNYFAVASFRTSQNRKAINVASVKAFFIDIDAGKEKLAKHGPDKVYADRDAAFVALQQFVEDTALLPTLVVSSGEGLHVYFALDVAITAEIWHPIAKRLQACCLARALKVDVGVTTDAARILRAPGTLHKNGRRVEVLDLPWTRGPYTLEELSDAIGPDETPPRRPSGAAARQAPRPYLPETPEFVGLMQRALVAIPAEVGKGCDRHVWMRVCFGTLATRWSCATDLIRTWSESGGDDFDDHEFEALVNSEKGEPTEGEVTPFSVFKTATEFGWQEDWPSLTREDRVAATYNIQEVWPEPEPIAVPLPQVKPLKTNLLPECMRAYVDDQTELMQTPPDFLAVSLMVCFAATIGNRIAIAPKSLDTSWLVVPALWGGLIGRPGVLKSPSVSRATSFVDLLEKQMVKSFDQQLQKYKMDKMAYAIWEAKAKKDLGAGNSITPMQEPEEPKPERLLINDSTFQKLTDVLLASPCGVLVCRDELTGLLESLRAQGQEQARAGYLEAWNGLGSYRVDRVGRGSFVIPRMFLCMLGGIQPGKLEPYIVGATQGGAQDDGLLQRFQLLVWPEMPETWTNVDRTPDWDAADAVNETFKYLRTLDPVQVGAEVDPTDSRPAFLQLAPDAQQAFDQWREKLEIKLRSGDLRPALEAHLSKYRSLIPALALVIHLADRGTGPVTISALVKAIFLSDYLWSHARRVYACVTHAQAFSANSLAERIKAGKLKDGFTARSIQRHGWQHLSTAEDVRDALDWLVDAKWLRAVPKGSGSAGGKPTETYVINPKVKTEGG
jgi:hypothetical protein